MLNLIRVISIFLESMFLLYKVTVTEKRTLVNHLSFQVKRHVTLQNNVILPISILFISSIDFIHDIVVPVLFPVQHIHKYALP